MARAASIAKPIPLLGGAYQSRSLITGAQRSVNLYPETYPPDSQAPVPVTHFLTPGLLLKGTAAVVRPFRRLGLYTATNGELFGVVGGTVYYIDSNYQFTFIGNVTDAVTPVSMWDNGQALVIVDGTDVGYALDLTTHDFGIIGTGYQASARVDYIDTFFIFNVVGTNQFYISLSNVTYAMLIGGTAFDALDVAAKTGSSDPISTFIALRGELWLVGTLTTEVWANSGGAEFPFERIPGALIEHGTAATYSIAKTDTSAYFLMQDRQGRAIISKTVGYALQRISTYAMEEAMQAYPTIEDAIAYTRQSEGHAFYVLTFPQADHTWVIELAALQPHEWESMDMNGQPHRHRSNCFAAAYNLNLVGDYQTPNLYSLDPAVYTDNGTPIRRLRSFPHMIESGNRVKYLYFMANIGCGQDLDAEDDPQCSLRWSDDRGASWQNAQTRSMGKIGEYNTWPRWNRLGMARDRVFELSWSVNAKTWLNGAFVAAKELAS